jgi:hypothetical protein
MTVVAAVKLEDLVPARESPRRADCTHGSLGPGTYHAHHFNGGESLFDHHRQRCLKFGWRTEACAARDSLFERRGYFRVRMTQDHRTPGKHIIDVSLVINVVDLRSLRLFDKERIAAHGAECPHRAVHAAGNIFFRLFEQFF